MTQDLLLNRAITLAKWTENNDGKIWFSGHNNHCWTVYSKYIKTVGVENIRFHTDGQTDGYTNHPISIVPFNYVGGLLSHI